MIDERNRNRTDDDKDHESEQDSYHKTRPDGTISKGEEDIYTNPDDYRVLLDPRSAVLSTDDD